MRGTMLTHATLSRMIRRGLPVWRTQTFPPVKRSLISRKTLASVKEIRPFADHLIRFVTLIPLNREENGSGLCEFLQMRSHTYYSWRRPAFNSVKCVPNGHQLV